ncbi:hypothetical protein B0H15DRAFT_815656 [Mycena belliarum]|uniref:DUF6534 domain-containing protein n=1 Tax=Mycena belliarum TaxID=1033014 RepID=A0AAD6XYA5_9AGAR|nr:hypothetical protein B0H15DRAFT_815656 [Mycena belliae]
MASPLAPTFGIWLVALFLQSILMGMGLLQVYLYFLWYHKDGWGIKGTVITITALEIAQSGIFFSATYTLLIDGFGNFPGLNVIPWQATTQLLLLYISTFVAQSYFSYCIYILQKRKLWFPLLIVIMSLVGLSGGIAQTILTLKIVHFTELPSTSWATNTQAALSLACDIFITGGLCWRLNTSRTGIQSTNDLLNFLIMTAINRGVLTMVTAALNMILFLSKPGTFYFMFALLLSGKLYMNSMLAMLNTRKHAHAISQFGKTTVDHISMGSFSPPTQGGVNVTVTHETMNDELSDRDKSKIMF